MRVEVDLLGVLEGGKLGKNIISVPITCIYYCVSLEIFIKCTTTMMGSEKGENCSGALPVGSYGGIFAVITSVSCQPLSATTMTPCVR